MTMTIKRPFLGGSLDGKELEVSPKLMSYRIPKPFIQTIADESVPSVDLDVETYLYDRYLGKFVEESMASDESIRWQTFQLQEVIGAMMIEANPDVIEFGIRQMNRRLDTYIAGEVIQIMQKVGVKLNVVKYLLDKNKELELQNERLKSANEFLDKKRVIIKFDVLSEIYRALAKI